MAYSKQKFQNGQTLDAANLETMENGIIAGQGVKNLLVNSNFKDPINSGGKTSWSASGFTIDKWRADSAATVNLTSSGITVDATSVAGNFQQNIDNLPNGTYTFAALVNNIIRTIVFTNDNGTITTVDNSNASFGGSGSINAGKESNAYYVQINNVQGHANTIAWAALYEGNYAVDTLPNYIPKDKHIEMSNCGIPAQPYNLFDNSNFRDPVNSRNIISTSDAGYHIDRWKKDNTNGTVVVGDGYLAMNGIGAQWFLTQHISTDKIKSGAVYTIALADTSGSISVCSTVMSTNMAKFTAQHTFANGAVVTTNVEYASDKYSVYFTSNSNARTQFAWAALYEGSYTADTLPPYVPKDKNVEIINCGIPLQPENLLVNSNFSDPVAPKGLNSRESYTTPGTLYLCDGWIGSEGIIAEQQSDGIKLTTTSDGSYITKYLNLQIGKTYTLALCASDISSQHRIELYDTETYGLITQRTSSDEILVINFRNSYDKIMMTYRPGYSNEGGSSVLKWAALYEGSYTAETLPGYVPKDKYIEMLNCGVSLAPRNLLNNSDFRDPVNSQGKTKYTGDTNAIDKWKLSGGSASTLTLVNRYARLAAGQASTAVLTQYISGLRDGVYTQALNLAGTIYTRIIKLSGSTITTIDESNAAYDSGHIDCSVDSSGNYSFNFSTSNGIDILWAALYEGAYTVDIIPPYIPKDRRVEMINCGISRQPQNLLDNSDFNNPVNSRGKNTYSDEGNEYTIDKWKTKYKSNISIENGYINIFGHWGLEQYIQNPKDGIYTFAARIRINSIGRGEPVIYVDDNSGPSNDLFLDANIGEWKTYILQHDFSSTTGETIIFAFSLRGGDTTASISVEWAAMYKGAYTADTLPPYVPKGKHVEMINCGVPLQPRNLLDNSDFRIINNIINTKGLTDYSFDSGDVFDRWRLHWTGDGRVSIKDGYIELYRKTNSTYLFQHPKDLENMIGKTYTVAAKVRYNGLIGWIDSTQRVNSGFLALDDWDIATCTFTVGSATSDIGKAGIEIATKANLSFEVQWIALYEGAYTKETLPTYITKDRHVEMLNCGVPLTPRNLLDNSDFRNPINSRGQSSYTGQVYTIDRWKIFNTTLIIGDGYINSPEFYQDLHIPQDKIYTFAVGAQDGTIAIISGKPNEAQGATMNGITVILTVDEGLTEVVVQTEKNVVWAALYEGSYTADTLPAYVPKDKHIEMLNCNVPTSPRNVLKNSDFTHPLNTKGFSSISSGAYTTIDCWNSWISGNGGKIELTSSGIKLSPPSSENIGIYQQIENYQLNKIYTIVVYINDLPYLKSFQMGNYGVGTKLGSVYFYSIPSANVLIRINSTDSAVTIQKIALYEGAYTLDTIPMYQSEGRHVEMLNCNVSLAPNNLLDNSDFSNTIAQAGLNGMHGSTKYVCDRWISWSADATFGNGYITPGSPIDQHLSKTAVDINKTYTAAICLSDGTIKAESGTFSNGFGSYALGIYCIKQEDSSGYVAVRLNTGNNIRWAALYEGAYDASTLPAYQPKGYAAELAECQRYYYAVENELLFSAWADTNGCLDYTVLLPQTMRAIPTVTFDRLQYADESGYVSFTNSPHYTGRDRVAIRKVSGLTPNKAYGLIMKFSASADL